MLHITGLLKKRLQNVIFNLSRSSAEATPIFQAF